MYIVTHDVNVTTRDARTFSVLVEFTGDRLDARGLLDYGDERIIARVHDIIDALDVERYGTENTTLERLASIVFHSLTNSAPLLTAVSIMTTGGDRCATYRDGPSISDVVKLRAALASLGYANPHDAR